MVFRRFHRRVAEAHFLRVSTPVRVGESLWLGGTPMKNVWFHGFFFMSLYEDFLIGICIYIYITPHPQKSQNLAWAFAGIFSRKPTTLLSSMFVLFIHSHSSIVPLGSISFERSIVHSSSPAIPSATEVLHFSWWNCRWRHSLLRNTLHRKVWIWGTRIGAESTETSWITNTMIFFMCAHTPKIPHISFLFINSIIIYG